MNEISERIIKTRKAKKMRQYQLAALLGISQQNLSALERGHVEQPRYISKLCEMLDISPEWLMYGIEQNKKDTHEKIAGIEWFTLAKKITCKQWDLSCKVKVLSGDKDFEVMNFANFHSNCFATRVYGDAMNAQAGSGRSFSSGDVIIIDPDKEAEANSFVLAYEANADQPIFKQLIIDGARKYLKSLNPHYAPVLLTNTIKIFGVVVATFSMC